MKRLVLTFLSAAAVGAVVSATPAAAQDRVTGAPAGTAPVTVEAHGNSSGDTGPSAPASGSALSGTLSSIATPQRCHVTHGFDNTEEAYTVVCGP
jgi:hypothetical protein